MINIFRVLVFLLSTPTFADVEFAGHEELLSLADVHTLARNYAPDLAIARYQLDFAEAQRGVATGQLGPQLSIFGQWSENSLKYEGPLSSVYGEQSYRGERYGLQLRQPLFNMTRFREVQRQNALFAGAKSNLKLAEIELLQAVTGAYLDVILANATVSQFESELDALDQQRAEAEALYDRSLLPVTLVLETKTRFQSVTADLIDAQAQTLIKLETLALLTGREQIDLQLINENLVLPTGFLSLEAVVELAIANSPAIDAAESAVDAAKAAVDREKGSWWPEIDLLVSQQYSDVGYDNLTAPPRTSDIVQISVNYPIFQGGAGTSRRRAAWAEFYTARRQLEAIKRETVAKVRSAWHSLLAATERMVATKQAFETANTSVLAAQKSVRAGSARVSDVLLALAQRTSAQRNFTYAQLNSVISWLELQLLTGRDPLSAVSELSDLLLPERVSTSTNSVINAAQSAQNAIPQSSVQRKSQINLVDENS